MLVNFIGKIHSVSDIRSTANGKDLFEAVIYVPRPRNSFGVEYGLENYYSVQVWEPKLHTEFCNHKGQLMRIEAYLNGNRSIDKDGNAFTNNRLNLRKIDIYEPQRNY